MASLFPPVGSWYQDLTTSKSFEIISIDEKESLIEVQFQDGESEEFNIQTWSRMKIIAVSSDDVSSSSNFDIDEDFMSDDTIEEDFSSTFGRPESDSFGGYDDLY